MPGAGPGIGGCASGCRGGGARCGQRPQPSADAAFT
jgi:hypothetical protein